MRTSKRRKSATFARAAAAAVAEASDPALEDPALYVNRELSLLAFQERVLEEAQDETNPLLERAKFLSIVGSNLDEFFMVRVAGLLAQVDAGTVDTGPDGMSPSAQLVAIRREVKKLLTNAYRCWSDLSSQLRDAGVHVLDYAELSDTQRRIADLYFENTIYPVLTPLAFDPGRPFPHISNRSLNLAVLIRGADGQDRFARIKVPDTLPQFVTVDRSVKKTAKRRLPRVRNFVWLEQVIAANLQTLFPGMVVVEAHPFHVTRDAEVAIKELEAEDLLETIEAGVRQRRFGDVVRLKVTADMPQMMTDILMSNLEVNPSELYRVRGPLSLTRFMGLYGTDRPDLKYSPFIPALPAAMQNADDEDIFATIRRQDVMLHHPFESFQPVIDFVRKAAHDPDVLAIKMTLYRVGRNSPIVEALLEALEEGKQVAVLVELKARFDEESNIEWARALEREGVHVVYGLLGLKIHAKLCLVVRRESENIRRYVHLSTGNYNALTAHLYTDIGLFTANDEIAADVTDLFNYLTGYSAKQNFQKLLVAPVAMRDQFEALILREIEHHRAGGHGRLVFKMNALVDTQIIRLLYRASQEGVKIDLLVRGVCCLRPGIPGISENIQVTSIVGRFLEHSRLFYFRNGGAEEIYSGSADLMPRNINRRVETMFPLEDEGLVAHVKNDLLATYLADNVKARRMKSDGSYSRVTSDGAPVMAQSVFLEQAKAQKKSR
jgi:polyphosphate kinase